MLKDEAAVLDLLMRHAVDADGWTAIEITAGTNMRRALDVDDFLRAYGQALRSVRR